MTKQRPMRTPEASGRTPVGTSESVRGESRPAGHGRNTARTHPSSFRLNIR
jgi:hypothetical protein